MTDSLEGWECARCHGVPLSLALGLSDDLKMGICSNYTCPSRAPKKIRLKTGGYSNVTGHGLFKRRTP